MYSLEVLDNLPALGVAATPDLSVAMKLKRMPHLFTRVLELPFPADTAVKMVESRDSYAFVVRLPGMVARDVKAEVMEIVPGATKVVVRGVEPLANSKTSPEVGLWRFRLPATTDPEGSIARYEHEVLSVTIPKISVTCKGVSYITSKNDGDWNISSLPQDIFNRIGDDLSDGSVELFETEEERIQREVLEDLESFGSPRRTRNVNSCTQSSVVAHRNGWGGGSWMGGFTIFVQ